MEKNGIDKRQEDFESLWQSNLELNNIESEYEKECIDVDKKVQEYKQKLLDEKKDLTNKMSILKNELFLDNENKLLNIEGYHVSAERYVLDMPSSFEFWKEQLEKNGNVKLKLVMILTNNIKTFTEREDYEEYKVDRQLVYIFLVPENLKDILQSTCKNFTAQKMDNLCLQKNIYFLTSKWIEKSRIFFFYEMQENLNNRYSEYDILKKDGWGGGVSEKIGFYVRDFLKCKYGTNKILTSIEKKRYSNTATYDNNAIILSNQFLEKGVEFQNALWKTLKYIDKLDVLQRQQQKQEELTKAKAEYEQKLKEYEKQKKESKDFFDKGETL